MPQPLRLLIVDDDALHAEVLAVGLGAEEGVEVVGVAADGREALRLAVRRLPDVVLMDVQMPHLDGIEATRRLQYLVPSARVVVLSGSLVADDVARALAAGAAAWVPKGRPYEEVLAAVRDAVRDQPPISRSLFALRRLEPA